MTNIACLYLYKISRIGKIIELENRKQARGYQGWGKRGMEYHYLMSTEFGVITVFEIVVIMAVKHCIHN